MAQRIGNIESEAEEHRSVPLEREPCDFRLFSAIITEYELTRRATRLVIDTLEPLPRDRKCFRMVNGVLVERTVEDVLPSLKTNSDGLKQVLEELMKQYKAKQDELDNWKVGAFLRTVEMSRRERRLLTHFAL